MSGDDLNRLAVLHADLAKLSSTVSLRKRRPTHKRDKFALSRHPLSATIVGFVLTGIVGGYLTYWFNYQNQRYQLETSTRESAIAAVSDLSDLVNERRERAVLVISSIRRVSPEEEAKGRKLAYDEAYVRWNARVPGDLLKIRAGLGASYRSTYERYIDGLTNFNVLLYGTDATKLLDGQLLPPKPGLFSAMDSCLTRASDEYRANKYQASPAAEKIVSDCKFYELYSRSIRCFSKIAESLYSAVSDIKIVPTTAVSEQQVIEACQPPA